mmetsp:Transcript_39546/g.58206  ORF Transcript_39546/g.58206 Transcript_39546/m.58206 type:complete len:105 (+) Transcript_39546:36-350(+)
MGAGAISPNGHVAEALNFWTCISAMCAVCACISTVYYLRVKEKYLEKANEDYADEIRAKNRVPAKKKQDLEIMLRKMQSEVNEIKSVFKAEPKSLKNKEEKKKN